MSNKRVALSRRRLWQGILGNKWKADRGRKKKGIQGGRNTPWVRKCDYKSLQVSSDF